MANPQQPQQGRPYNEAELQRLAVSTSQVGNEELVIAAMLGKVIQNDLNGLKKQSAEVGGGLKVTDVDMSKLMPSHILPRTGFKGQQVAPQRPTPPPQQPLNVQPVVQSVPQPELQFIAPPVQQVQAFEQPYVDPNQLEFDLNKQTRYEVIINAIDKLENKVNILTDKVNQLIDSNNKKKPKITNGT